MFFSFDGIDGVGKSTQIELFADAMRSAGRDVVCCRDPGSTQLGESLREILLNNHDVPISAASEMLIYMAARAQLVNQIIRPALDAGKVVISDRYLLANVVYQGYAGGLEIESVRRVGQVATGGLLPSLTFLLDMSVEAAAKRIDRALDRMESRGHEYLQRVREGFLAEAARNPDRIVLIDASRDVAAIQKDVIAAAEKSGVLKRAGC